MKHNLCLTFPVASNPVTGRETYTRPTCVCGWRGLLHHSKIEAITEGSKHCEAPK